MVARFAKVFPIGKARAVQCQGWLEHLQGKSDKARQTWERAVPAAHTMGMPYEEALLHYEIGRHAGGAQRIEHLRRALALFDQLDASYDADRTRALLEAAPQI